MIPTLGTRSVGARRQIVVRGPRLTAQPDRPEAVGSPSVAGYNPGDVHSTTHLAEQSWVVFMSESMRSSSDIIIRTGAWAQATAFYESVLGLAVAHRSENLVGFNTGAFCLYVEKGQNHGPVFEFLVSDVEAAKMKLLAAGCTVQEEDPSVPRCYIRDPYGLVFNIAKARSPQ
jgi:predicted enzyme related to lactoylglutathione lyase